MWVQSTLAAYQSHSSGVLRDNRLGNVAHPSTQVLSIDYAVVDEPDRSISARYVNMQQYSGVCSLDNTHFCCEGEEATG